MTRRVPPPVRYPKRRTELEAEVNADLLGRRAPLDRDSFWARVHNQTAVRDLEREVSR